MFVKIDSNGYPESIHTNKVLGGTECISYVPKIDTRINKDGSIIITIRKHTEHGYVVIKTGHDGVTRAILSSSTGTKDITKFFKGIGVLGQYEYVSRVIDETVKKAVSVGLDSNIIVYERCCDVESPRTFFDNLGTMVYCHSRYNLGDEEWCPQSDDFIVEYFAEKLGYSVDDIEESSKVKDEVMDYIFKNVIYKLLYIYDHGGVTIQAAEPEDGNPFTCGWDSSFVGFIYVEKDKLKDGISKERAAEILEHEIRQFDAYLQGETYCVYDGYGYSVFYGEDELKEFAKQLGAELVEQKQEDESKQPHSF